MKTIISRIKEAAVSVACAAVIAIILVAPLYAVVKVLMNFVSID